jgi:hypothetical protein
MQSKGWAVIADGEINVKTVSPTRRAAIVNWLTVDLGFLIHNHHTDEQIESAWEYGRPEKRGARVAEVVIFEAAGQS